MRRSHGPYKGVLTEPIEKQGRRQPAYEPPLPVDRRRQAEAFEKQKTELAARIDALFDHYDVDRHDGSAWQQLAMKLAYDHVAGFGFKAADGRHAEWGVGAYHVLYRHYLRVKRQLLQEDRARQGNRKVTDTRVAQRFNKDTQFLNAFPSLTGAKTKTLCNRISEAKKRRQQAIDARRNAMEFGRTLSELEDIYSWGGPTDTGHPEGDWPAGTSALYRKYEK